MVETSEGFRKILLKSGLALRELELLTCPWLTGLLTFLHTRVASEQTSLLERRTEFAVELEKGSSDAEGDRASLTAVTTALYTSNDVDLVLELSRGERGEGDTLEVVVGEKVFVFLAVDDDLAAAFLEANASNCSFTTASA